MPILFLLLFLALPLKSFCAFTSGPNWKAWFYAINDHSKKNMHTSTRSPSKTKNDYSHTYQGKKGEIQHTYSISHKDHGPQQQAKDVQTGKPFYYTKDAQGKFWVNITDPKNSFMLDSFLKDASDADILHLAEDAPGMISNQIMLSRLLTVHERIPDDIIKSLIAKLSDQQLCMLLASEHYQPYFAHKTVQNRCFTTKFAQEWLWKLNNEKLSYIFEQFPTIAVHIIQPIVMKCDADRLHALLTEYASPAFIQHPAVHAACLSPIFANKYIWHFDNGTVSQWIKSSPQACKQPHLYPRILYLQNSEYTSLMLSHMTPDMLIKALDKTVVLPADIRAKFASIDPLEDTALQNILLDPKNGLLSIFVKKSVR